MKKTMKNENKLNRHELHLARFYIRISLHLSQIIIIQNQSFNEGHLGPAAELLEMTINWHSLPFSDNLLLLLVIFVILHVHHNCCQGMMRLFMVVKHALTS